jgi:hypothetical protein
MGVNRTDWIPFVFLASLTFLSDFLINIKNSNYPYIQRIKNPCLHLFHYL